jgi:nitrite reductase/ring-hydroxylating ferredoxin subunit
MGQEPMQVLKDMARQTIAYGRDGTTNFAENIMRLDASVYYDEDLFERELDQIFKRIPIVLGPSCEIPEPGDFKTMKVARSSIIVARGKDGVARGFMNTCRHRGVKVENEPCGNRSRFTCPFHGWSFGVDGSLVGIASRNDFGDIDKAEYGLKQFPLVERAGLIWAIVNPDCQTDIDPFLAGYDEILSAFKFDEWKFFSKRQFRGPNWKLSYDGYLEYYHVPVLHNATFGGDTTNRGVYFNWGPHQHIKTPDLTVGHVATETLGYMANIADRPEDQWDLETLSFGVWTVFPCVSIASFGGGGRGVMISQVLPGETVGQSTTFQYYIMEKLPATQELADDAERQFAFLQDVVEREDIAQAYSAQDGLKGSGVKELLLGRNELGNQTFHTWCRKITEAETDRELAALYSAW